MTKAREVALASDQGAVTAADIECCSGGTWDAERGLWVFPDGSAGAFVKFKPSLKDNAFAGYRFSDDPEELGAPRRPEKVG
jgi:hypothetical protein